MAAAISTSHQKIAILLYDDRSGSTLFASLLAKHPKVAVTIEGELFAHIFSLPAKALCEDDVRAALDAISNDVKLRNWRIDRNKVIEGFRRLSSSCRRKDFAKLLLEDVVNGLNPNAAVCVFKHGNINYVNRYKALFPEAHFLHIYRDGRAVYASKKRARHSVRNKPMANNPIQAARAWADLMREVELLRGSERFLEIQYEALLHDPERKLRKVCKFLGIDEEPFVGGVGAGDKTGYLEEIPEEQKHLHRLLGKGVVESRAEAWRTELSPVEIDLFQSVAACELIGRGYSLLTEPESHGQQNFRERLRWRSRFAWDCAERACEWMLSASKRVAADPAGAIRRRWSARLER